MIAIEKAIRHPKYNSHKYDNDFVLIKLKEQLQFNDQIQPIRLPEAKATVETGRMCLVTGWGTVRYGTMYVEDLLRGVEVPIVDQQICRKAYQHVVQILTSMVCAGFYGEGGKDCKCKTYCKFITKMQMDEVDNENVGFLFVLQRVKVIPVDLWLHSMVTIRIQYWLVWSVGASVVLNPITLVYMLECRMYVIGSVKSPTYKHC